MSLPRMKQALHGLMDNIPAQVVQRTIVDHEVVESVVFEKIIPGLMLPMQPRKIAMKPEGERSWDWQDFTTTERLELGWSFIDTRTGRRYRVMSIEDYGAAGFYHYEIVQKAKEGSGDV